MTALIPRMMNPLSSLQEITEQIWGRDLLAPFTFGRTTTYQCPVNVYEDNDNYYVQALLPGINPEELSIQVVEGTLTISGEVKLSTPEKARVIWNEFQPFRFQRSIQLGAPIDAGKVEAAYHNGVLTVTAPKQEHVRPRVIKVHSDGKK